MLGAALVWFGLWPGSRNRDRAESSYGNGRWSEAAEHARLRLKAAPEDREALRLLARSTARLGRDGQANTLFARLGEGGLEAEDLFLLGLGLKRAGQADRALGVWEQAVAKDAHHAEALAQLALEYTARNRLVEAARLYERLARIPGWEMRGELSLGGLRSELNDPAGASLVLRTALGRAEADSLDPAGRARYRKLLARNLLRTGNADQARAELQRLLEAGPDPEASWLLSRAFLQEGEVAQARRAVEQSGSFRAEHPLELEPGTYLGEGRCVECHGEIARAYHASRTARTLLRGAQLMDLPYPADAVSDPSDPEVTHVFRKADGHVQVETRKDDRIFRAVVDYAFGAPDRYVSLVGHDEEGRSHILRLSHFRESPRESGWVRTTGHTADAEGGKEILGKPLDEADGVLKCLFCHSTNPQAVLAGSGPESSDRAIGCERCHGPGGNHVQAVRAQLTDLAIVNPSLGAGEARLRLCAQCHALHQEMSLPRTDPYWIRFQGTTLPWSRCYTESGGTLDCVTCHDPHRDAERSPSYYDEKCRSCHTGPQRTNPVGRPVVACPIDRDKGCVDCHMPSVRSEPLHATFADHYIRVHPDGGQGAKSGEPQAAR